jgi:hypothetical protein
MNRNTGALLCALSAFVMISCTNPFAANQGGWEHQIVAPQASSTVPGDRKITVQWISVATATGHEVWYGLEDDPSLAKQWTGAIVTDGRKNSTVIDKKHDGTPLENDVTWFIWTRAVFTAGTSGFGEMTSATPIPLPRACGDPAIDFAGDKNLEIRWTAGARAELRGVLQQYQRKRAAGRCAKTNNLRRPRRESKNNHKRFGKRRHLLCLGVFGEYGGESGI